MMTIIQAKSENDLTLGRQGENLARQVVFDLSAWEAEYGPGVAELIHQRPGDASPYPVAAVREGGTLVWTLTATDTAVASSYGSDGHCELRYYVGEVLVKSRTWLTKVIRAMSTPSETAPPEPEQGWVDQIIAVGAAAQASADAAKADADRATELAAEVAEKAAQTAQDASDAAKAMEAAQTAQRLAEEAQGAAETARTAAETAQAAAEQSATDAAGAKQDAETAQKAAQDAAVAAALALADIRALYQEMQTWAHGVIQVVNDAGSTAVQSVQSAGDAQVQRVAEEGTRQTANAKAQADAAAQYADAADKSAQKAEENAAKCVDLTDDVNQLKQDLNDKLDAPATTPDSAGKILRVLSVNDDGTFTCEWADVKIGGVTDVKINDQSIVGDGIANLPIVGAGKIGLVKMNIRPRWYGIEIESDGTLFLGRQAQRLVSIRNNGGYEQNYQALHPSDADRYVKAAMCDGIGASWTDAERIAALLRMGCTVDDNGFVKWTAQEVSE